MNITLHDTPEAYQDEYQRVRAALVVQGTSLSKWLETKNINRQLAYRALKGTSYSKEAIYLRARILEDVLAKAA